MPMPEQAERRAARPDAATQALARRTVTMGRMKGRFPKSEIQNLNERALIRRLKQLITMENGKDDAVAFSSWATGKAIPAIIAKAETYIALVD